MFCQVCWHVDWMQKQVSLSLSALSFPEAILETSSAVNFWVCQQNPTMYGVTIQMGHFRQYFCMVPFVFQDLAKLNLKIFLNFNFGHSRGLKV